MQENSVPLKHAVDINDEIKTEHCKLFSQLHI